MPLEAREKAWNDSMIEDFRAHAGEITAGPLAGAHLLLMTTTGARSGEPRISPLGYTRDGDGYVVVGSNSGRHTHPAWLENIRRHPTVTVEVGTETFPARARVTEGAERQRLWQAHVAAIPAFGNYESMTARELPVVVLERA